MMDVIFWWTGAIVWGIIAALLVWLFVEILIGFVAAISWCRWSINLIKTHSRQPKWAYLPVTFIRHWFEFVGYRNNGNTTYSGVGGYWNGIGDWIVYPPSEDEAAE